MTDSKQSGSWFVEFTNWVNKTDLEKVIDPLKKVESKTDKSFKLIDGVFIQAEKAENVLTCLGNLKDSFKEFSFNKTNTIDIKQINSKKDVIWKMFLYMLISPMYYQFVNIELANVNAKLVEANNTITQKEKELATKNGASEQKLTNLEAELAAAKQEKIDLEQQKTTLEAALSGFLTTLKEAAPLDKN